MDIGFIGLGNMGYPMAARLMDAGHSLVVFDSRREIVASAVASGAQAASSPRDVADRAETVLASLPSVQASRDVATGPDGVIEGRRVKRFVDLSPPSAVRPHGRFRHNWPSAGSRCWTARSAVASVGP